MAQILQGLSHKVCSTTSLKVLAYGSLILTFEIFAIIHQQLVCYGYAGSTYANPGANLDLSMSC